MQESSIRSSIRTVLFWTVFFTLTACSNHAADRARAAIPETATTGVDSVRAREAQVYTQAIAEYIQAVNKKDQARFDTLFFGKHADFPDIELPANIEHTNIRLVKPEDGLKKLQQDESTAFINMAGTVTEGSAEFVLVTFSHGGRHQFDYFIDLNYNPERKEFVSYDSRFENYIYGKDGKLERIAIYKDDKYVGDRSMGQSGK